VEETDEIERPEKAAEWLDLIADGERYFDSYFTACDNIDKLYADLNMLRNGSRDDDFALFWSNIQVMGPSIYARPPLPVVTPKFKDRRPLYRVASEMLERVSIVAFDQTDINAVMIQCRDDLSINGRGVAWVRYDDDDGQKVCIEHLDRRDFMHEPARKWADVGWVARRGWLCYADMKERFGKDVADTVSYSVRDTDNKFGPQDDTKKCGVWEIWHRNENKVIWVTQGVDDVLESDKPHLKLTGFFPCPQPAYATVQRRSLIPVADVIYYQGQLAQINELTARIGALGAALKMKGFYQGGGDIGNAVETAFSTEDDGRVLVPVSSMAAFGSGGDPVVWLPLDMVATTLTALVELRRQLIEDVYQIIGLSDIMRGSTDASETLGAQQLKQQNGSYRVRDKQNELVRLARDLVRISAEIIAENFDRKTLTDMAQMDIPTNAEISKQVKAIEGQAKALQAQMQDPQVQAMAEQQPDAAKQAMQQAEQQLSQMAQQVEELQDQPTIEDVLDFLQDEKLRPFVLDIETDSTIYPDEMREKASRSEFLTAFMGAMSGLGQMAALGPQAIGLAGGVLKFALAPYRVGRELEGLIDDFVDSAPQIAEQMAAAQGGGEDQAAVAKLAEIEMEKVKVQGMKAQADATAKMQDLQLKAQTAEAKAANDGQKLALELEKTKAQIGVQDATIQKIYAEIQAIGVKGQAEAAWVGLEQQSQRREDIKLAHDMTMQRVDTQLSSQESAREHEIGNQQRQHSQSMDERKQTLAEKAASKDGHNG